MNGMVIKISGAQKINLIMGGPQWSLPNTSKCITGQNVNRGLIYPYFMSTLCLHK
ncbi:hypothetical protein SAMN05216387_103306 [Nitrosovibrio tenuis]|uniref:Uncharacterized protein n=1 Tax=Nitrosovibrio tenuis TaxID=1233 RepID=A0A1H7KQ49_9PROT|nr:hypothetical protein SAMN05216387_103306 [Nitrosovibrio tenuis]